MKLTHEQQVQVAKAVLKAYGIHPSVSNAFRKGSKTHRLYYSEYLGKFAPAVLYWLSNEPSYEQMAKDFQEESGCLVFHAILSHTNIGDCLDILAVPSDSEDLEMFLKDAQKGYFMSHCHNLTTGDVDYGTIVVRPAMGGLVRIG